MLLWPHKYIRASKAARERLAGLRAEDVRSVAVIKHAALGDLVLARPFLTTVRKHFPNASITFGAIANYLNGVPEDLVDRVHVAAGQFRPRPSFRTRMRSYRELGYHDLIFDITASSASAWITQVNPARVKFGYRHSPLAPLLYDVTIPRGFMSFEAENFLHQLAILRIRYDWPLDFGWPAPQRATAPPYLVYFPTASVPEKCWPAERFGALLGRLAEALPDYEHRLLYGVADWEVETGDIALAAAGERPNVRAVRDAKGEAFHALLRGGTVLICNDTGVRNLAIGRGLPTLGIFDATTVDTYLPRFGHHDAVHEPNGGWPSVDAVAETALRMVNAIAHDPAR
ncbi:MAG TPA: glycosyltransferase family 9 protein [bacterium]|nr:glycosyltransferase family 9 protein [bacterium]